MNINVPNSDSGIVIIGIMLVRSEPMKATMTSSTNPTAMKTVIATSSTESFTGPEVSNAMSMTIPGGAARRRSGSMALAVALMSSGLAVD